MAKITNMFIIFACAVTLSFTMGCGKGEGSVKDQYMAQVDKVCACMNDPATAAECVAPIREAMKKIEKDNPDMPPEEGKALKKAAKAKMAECRSAARAGAAGATAAGATAAGATAAGSAKGKGMGKGKGKKLK